MQTDLLGLSFSELQSLCATLSLPRYTARQLCDWLYRKRVRDINQMTNISLAARGLLSQVAYIGRHDPVHCSTSVDGTKKYLFHTATTPIEAVFIPEVDRATLCVSSQAGCKMNCRFCATGKQGYHGSLSAGEILNQLFSLPECEEITNIVFMGMGEPMDNLDAVLAATEVLTAEWGLGWSPKRITVSSVGIIPSLQRFLEESRCHLAIVCTIPLPPNGRR